MKEINNFVKEIFRPTQTKIILAFVILILTILVFAYQPDPGYNRNVLTLGKTIVFTILFLPVPLSSVISEYFRVQAEIGFFLLIILEILYTYIISCVLIGIYKKLVSKLKK